MVRTAQNGTMMQLPLSEAFYSIQGEGPTMGKPSVFIRLAGCNLMCGGQGTQFDGELHNGAKWRCDTVEVWMKGMLAQFHDIFDQFKRRVDDGAHVIITGGEPLMHGSKLTEFLSFIRGRCRDAYIEVETNGTIMPESAMLGLVNQWNVSPKLQSSGNSGELRYRPEVLKKLKAADSYFKFVVSDKRDLKEIITMLAECKIPKEQVYLMPAGESQELLNETRPKTVEMALAWGFNYSERLHIVIWNKKTGV